jgi:hypothetical protein
MNYFERKNSKKFFYQTSLPYVINEILLNITPLAQTFFKEAKYDGFI